jgi:hypothetical protein
MKKRLSDLIEELADAKAELRKANEVEEIARHDYTGVSWGYHGSAYMQDINEAEAKIAEIKKQIDEL